MLLADADTVAIVNTVANVLTTLITVVGGVVSAYIAYRLAVLSRRVNEVKADVKTVKKQTDGMHKKLVEQAFIEGERSAILEADNRPADAQQPPRPTTTEAPSPPEGKP